MSVVRELNGGQINLLLRRALLTESKRLLAQRAIWARLLREPSRAQQEGELRKMCKEVDETIAAIDALEQYLFKGEPKP